MAAPILEGQVWSVDDTKGRRYARVDLVDGDWIKIVGCNADGSDKLGGRMSTARRDRFNGRYAGFCLHQDVKPRPPAPENRAERAEVYAAIDGERAYQDKRWSPETTPTGGRHNVAEFVLFMEHYLGEARRLLSTQPDPQAEHDGLDFVRKVTALGVACMEQNGVVVRE